RIPASHPRPLMTDSFRRAKARKGGKKPVTFFVPLLRYTNTPWPRSNAHTYLCQAFYRSLCANIANGHSLYFALRASPVLANPVQNTYLPSARNFFEVLRLNSRSVSAFLVAALSLTAAVGLESNFHHTSGAPSQSAANFSNVGGERITNADSEPANWLT